ncbi:MAG: DNA starvation/stationary phase protection protein [Armatimonas sp.]
MEINIGLTAKERTGSAELLHKALADAHVLYIKTRKYHWNIIGLQFAILHPFLEQQYDQLAMAIDEIAERSRMLGVQAPGTMAEFLKLARLKECTSTDLDATHMLTNLLKDHEAVIRQLREDFTTCTETYKDDGTADFLIGLLENHEKMAWMLRAHLQSR